MAGDVPDTHTLANVLARLQAGERPDADPELAGRLNLAFAKHEAALRRFCTRELRGFPPSIVDEVVQDVFEIAWRKLQDYRGEGRFKSWLWGIAGFRCLAVRRKCRDVLSEDGLFGEDVHGDERSAFERLADGQRDGLVDEAARNVLDEKLQELIHLRWVLDYPQPEVARMLGMPDANSVRVAVLKCKRRMEKEITRLMGERGLTSSFLAGSGKSGSA